MAGKFAGLITGEGIARMMLKHPRTGEPVIRNDTNEECWIEGYASESKRGNLLDREMTTKNMRRRTTMRGRDVEENTIIKLAGLTTAWSLALLDGSPIDVPCTPENASEIFTDVLWLRNAWSVFVNDLGNFPPTPSENSLTSPSTASG